MFLAVWDKHLQAGLLTGGLAPLHHWSFTLDFPCVSWQSSADSSWWQCSGWTFLGKGMCKNNKLDKIKEEGEKKENRMQH